MQASPSIMLAVMGLALFPTILAYFAWNYALGELPAGVAANFLYLVAPVATLLAFLFFGDKPSIHTILGGAMAMLGTIIAAKWG